MTLHAEQVCLKRRNAALLPARRNSLLACTAKYVPAR